MGEEPEISELVAVMADSMIMRPVDRFADGMFFAGATAHTLNLIQNGMTRQRPLQTRQSLSTNLEHLYDAWLPSGYKGSEPQSSSTLERYAGPLPHAALAVHLDIASPLWPRHWQSTRLSSAVFAACPQGPLVTAWSRLRYTNSSSAAVRQRGSAAAGAAADVHQFERARDRELVDRAAPDSEALGGLQEREQQARRPFFNLVRCHAPDKRLRLPARDSLFRVGPDDVCAALESRFVASACRDSNAFCADIFRVVSKHQVVHRAARAGYSWRMARRAKGLEMGPVVVPIHDDYKLSMDDWLGSLLRSEPVDLPISGADLVAEARAEQE